MCRVIEFLIYYFLLVCCLLLLNTRTHTALPRIKDLQWKTCKNNLVSVSLLTKGKSYKGKQAQPNQGRSRHPNAGTLAQQRVTCFKTKTDWSSFLERFLWLKWICTVKNIKNTWKKSWLKCPQILKCVSAIEMLWSYLTIYSSTL